MTISGTPEGIDRVVFRKKKKKLYYKGNSTRNKVYLVGVRDAGSKYFHPAGGAVHLRRWRAD